jgi:hypothetical protein
MAITRSQIARQLMQEGGVPRQGYFLGKLVRKIKDDIIPNELKSPAGLAATALAANYAPKLFGSDTLLTQLSNKVPFIGTVTDAIGGGLSSAKEAVTDALGTKVGTGENETTLGNRLLSGILGGPGLALASGLLAGAFTKDKEDPLYTGQDVGLNLQNIGKLANITDPRVGQAIGLRFLPDVEARKFTPEQMAETFAANQPMDFTEKREQAQDGGMMGDQKDFEEFLQDMQNRDKSMLQDRILKDFEEFMKRKRMLEQLPEVKDGGIIKMAEGGMMDMGGMEMDLRGGGFVPMGRAEKADDVPARLSKNEFVFTADAVRAAGGGDVDKGADKMYATMKKLEDRVA